MASGGSNGSKAGILNASAELVCAYRPIIAPSPHQWAATGIGSAGGVRLLQFSSLAWICLLSKISGSLPNIDQAQSLDGFSKSPARIGTLPVNFGASVSR